METTQGKKEEDGKEEKTQRSTIMRWFMNMVDDEKCVCGEGEEDASVEDYHVKMLKKKEEIDIRVGDEEWNGN